MDFQVLLLTIGVSFILAVIAAPLLIPLLRRLKFGQQVREDGPQSHLKKRNTYNGWSRHFSCVHIGLFEIFGSQEYRLLCLACGYAGIRADWLPG